MSFSENLVSFHEYYLWPQTRKYIEFAAPQVQEEDIDSSYFSVTFSKSQNSFKKLVMQDSLFAFVGELGGLFVSLLAVFWVILHLVFQIESRLYDRLIRAIFKGQNRKEV